MKVKILAVVLIAVVAANAQSLRTARDYYQQLYKAGGFSLTPANSYVCFSDDAYDDFFTFRTAAFDDNFNKAMDNYWKLPDAEKSRQYNIQQGIQQQAGVYVNFIPEEHLATLPPENQKFYRRGGRVLEMTVYEKGVKTSVHEYLWGNAAWTISEPEDPMAHIKTSKIFQLSIEPTTMRYVRSTMVTVTVETGTAETTRYAPWGGTCERILDRNVPGAPK